MSVQRLRWTEATPAQRSKALMRPAVQRSEALSLSVKGIIDDVRARGDAAVLDYTSRFDRVTLEGLRVTPADSSGRGPA